MKEIKNDGINGITNQWYQCYHINQSHHLHSVRPSFQFSMVEMVIILFDVHLGDHGSADQAAQEFKE